MKTVKSIITGFAKHSASPDHFVVFTTTYQQDDLTGLSLAVKRAYICVNTHYFKDFVKKECVLTLETSPKLKKDVCIDIRLSSEKGEEYEEAF